MIFDGKNTQKHAKTFILFYFILFYVISAGPKQLK